MMRKIIVLAFLYIPYVVLSQDSVFFTHDTVMLEEIVISDFTPVNDKALFDFYKESAQATIDDILSRTNGVHLISRGAYAHEPTINGMSAGQIQITIDEMRLFGACTDKMDPVTSYVDTDNCSGISVEKGASASHCGASLGGALTMKLERVDEEDTVLKAVAGFGLNSVSDGYNMKLKVASGMKRFGVAVNTSFYKQNNYTDGNNNEIPFSQYTKLNVGVNTSLNLKSGKLICNYIFDNATDVGYAALPMDVSSAVAHIAGAEYVVQPKTGRWNSLSLKLYGNSITHIMDDSQRDSLYLVDNKQGGVDSVYMRMDMPGWSDTYGAFIKGEYALSAKQTLRFKFEDYLHYTKAEMTMYMNNLSHPGEPPMYVETWPEQMRNVVGLYLETQRTLSSKMWINLNGRFDFYYQTLLSDAGIQQFSVFGYDLEHSLTNTSKSLSFTFNNVLTRKLKYNVVLAYGERVPTTSEQFGYYLFNANDGYDYIGNPYLKNEKSEQVSASVNYASHSLKINTDIHLATVQDYIIAYVNDNYGQMNLYANGLKEYTNIDGATIFNTNLLINWKLHESVSFISNSGYTIAKTYNEQNLPLIPPFHSIAALNYKWKNSDFKVEMDYAARQNMVNEQTGEKPTMSYLLTNLRITHVFDIGKISIHGEAGVENVFDIAYRNHLDWGGINRPGRNLYINIVCKI